MGMNLKLFRQRTITEYLHRHVLTYQTGCFHCLQVDEPGIEFCGKSLKCTKIDTFKFNTVDILKAPLRYSSLQWHLATFKAYLLAVSRA